jgi:hypothetical protein
MILVFCSFNLLCLADDLHMGTWKLNESKSKIHSDLPKKIMIVYAAEGENMKITLHGVDAYGKPMHNEWTGKFDGKDYPVTGDPTSNMRSYTKVDDSTLHAVVKKDGKIITEVHIVVSENGKSRTVTSNGTDSKGNKISSVLVYERQ